MRVECVFIAVVCALLCGFTSAQDNQLQPAALLETLVTYVPECGRPLCPASTLNAVIRGYECDCSKPQEHPDCGCAVLSGSSTQSCSGSSSPCSDAPPCQCETKKPDCLCNALQTNQKIEVRPLYIEPVNPVPLPPAASTECVPSVFGISPGSCKTHTQSSSPCGSSESNCASSSDSLSSSSAIASSAILSSASLSSGSLSASASPASQSADSSIYSSMLSSQGGAPTPTPASSASAILASASASASASAIASASLSASAVAPNSAAPKTSPAQSSATLTKF